VAESSVLSEKQFTILMPVYNDWTAASQVIGEIETVLLNMDICPKIILVDDGSTTPPSPHFIKNHLQKIVSVQILHLRRNLGHQRAIAVGLTYVFDKAPCDAIIVMDADGQDRPEDIPSLLSRFCGLGAARFIFAKRTKRPETVMFKAGYRCYRILHRVFTGLGTHVGNFSVIPFHQLSALVASSELWNHYAAAVHKLRLPVTTVDAPRGQRFTGESQMNIVSLVIHGLSAISVYSEIVATRTIVAAGVLCAILAGILITVVGVRLFTDLAIPGWATYSSGLLLILLVLVLATSSCFLLFVLGNRNAASFLPIRDYAFFIDKIKNVYPAQ
jgi:hypothetical protein